MSDLAGEKPSMSFTDRPSRSNHSSQGRTGGNRSGGSRGGSGGDFAKDLHSVSMRTEQRTFYFDLKESSHGKFIKLSEKSRNGNKSTIMLNGTDIDEFIASLTELKSHM